ncbi:ankyrin repeat and LEM domain-containing protein 1 isoform X2 [Anolis carolinensis]|uniref:ankyrin repeat and LEM domain-containing protein 1 isoform X2 n=1 Tax=Anolis carolinensis TaxID=28377 RepID=UPI002F2B50AE
MRRHRERTTHARLQLSAWLCQALRGEDDTMVEILLRKGADPNLVLPEGMAPIHLAAGMDQESGLRCLGLLLRHGGDPNTRSTEDLTPVHVAASWGCATCLRLLLAGGGDPRIRDQDGSTALDLALEQGNGVCARILRQALERENVAEQSSYRRAESFLSTTTDDTMDVGGIPRNRGSDPFGRHLKNGNVVPYPSGSFPDLDDSCSGGDRRASSSFLTECSWSDGHDEIPTRLGAESKWQLGRVNGNRTFLESQSEPKWQLGRMDGNRTSNLESQSDPKWQLSRMDGNRTSSLESKREPKWQLGGINRKQTSSLESEREPKWQLGGINRKQTSSLESEREPKWQLGGINRKQTSSLESEREPKWQLGGINRKQTSSLESEREPKWQLGGINRKQTSSLESKREPKWQLDRTDANQTSRLESESEPKWQLSCTDGNRTLSLKSESEPKWQLGRTGGNLESRSQEILKSDSEPDHLPNADATLDLTLYRSFLDPELVVRPNVRQGLDATSPDHVFLFSREDAAMAEDLERTLAAFSEGSCSEYLSCHGEEDGLRDGSGTTSITSEREVETQDVQDTVLIIQGTPETPGTSSDMAETVVVSGTSPDTVHPSPAEEVLSSLEAKLRDMMLATKASRSPLIRTVDVVERRFPAPAASSLFDEDLEMPRRPRRVRSPEAGRGCVSTAGPQNESPETGPLADTQLIPVVITEPDERRPFNPGNETGAERFCFVSPRDKTKERSDETGAEHFVSLRDNQKEWDHETGAEHFCSVSPKDKRKERYHETSAEHFGSVSLRDKQKERGNETGAEHFCSVSPRDNGYEKDHETGAEHFCSRSPRDNRKERDHETGAKPFCSVSIRDKQEERGHETGTEHFCSLSLRDKQKEQDNETGVKPFCSRSLRDKQEERGHETGAEHFCSAFLRDKQEEQDHETGAEHFCSAFLRDKQEEQDHETGAEHFCSVSLRDKQEERGDKTGAKPFCPVSPKDKRKERDHETGAKPFCSVSIRDKQKEWGNETGAKPFCSVSLRDKEKEQDHETGAEPFCSGSLRERGNGNAKPLSEVKSTRVSFSRMSLRGPSLVATSPQRSNPVVQASQLSPGGRPVGANAAEPLEYLYVDEEEGHSLVERRVPFTDESLAGSEDTVVYDWRDHPGTLSDEALVRELRDFGVNPGPVTGLTRKVYAQLLEKLRSDPRTKARKDAAGYSPELAFALETFLIPDAKEDEMALMAQFDRPDQNRKWREGLLKSSFNYLLLDPRVTQNLPFRCHFVSQAECFRTFVSAVFYVGKGQRSRPYSHLYQALTHHNRQGKTPGKVSSKVQHILEIWESGQGVVSLHCFQNVVPVEAYTREACMVDAIGLKMLTNLKRGDYYGLVAGWPWKRRRRLGVFLLHRAMCIFLAEGERQLRPADIRTP